MAEPAQAPGSSRSQNRDANSKHQLPTPTAYAKPEHQNKLAPRAPQNHPNPNAAGSIPLSPYSGKNNGSDGKLKVREDNKGWYYPRGFFEKDTPSRHDGMSMEEEDKIRQEYSKFCIEAGQKIGWVILIVATAIIFCHRFYARRSMKRYDWRKIAASALFLAGKVEESPKMIRDLVEVLFIKRYPKSEAKLEELRKNDYKNEIMEYEKAEIIKYEREILTTIEFDMNVIHPYKYIFPVRKKLEEWARQRKWDGFSDVAKKVAQLAWNFVNDSLTTTICLEYRPKEISISVIYMAMRLVQPQKGFPGFADAKDRMLQVLGATSPELVKAISSRLMSMYGHNDSDGKKNKTENDSSSKETTKTENSEKEGKDEGQNAQKPAEGIKKRSRPSRFDVLPKDAEQIRNERRQKTNDDAQDAQTAAVKAEPAPNSQQSDKGVQGPEMKPSVSKPKPPKINAKLDLSSVSSGLKPAENTAPAQPGSFRNQIRPRMDLKPSPNVPMWPHPGGAMHRHPYPPPFPAFPPHPMHGPGQHLMPGPVPMGPGVAMPAPQLPPPKIPPMGASAVRPAQQYSEIEDMDMDAGQTITSVPSQPVPPPDNERPPLPPPPPDGPPPEGPPPPPDVPPPPPGTSPPSLPPSQPVVDNAVKPPS